MATMKAYRLVKFGEPPRFEEVEILRPGPGDVLIKMAGWGRVAHGCQLSLSLG